MLELVSWKNQVYQPPKLHLHPIHPLRARGTIDGCALNLQVVCYFVQSCRVWNVAHKSHGTQATIPSHNKCTWDKQTYFGGLTFNLVQWMHKCFDLCNVCNS
jgi:hypothetical protein